MIRVFCLAYFDPGKISKISCLHELRTKHQTRFLLLQVWPVPNIKAEISTRPWLSFLELQVIIMEISVSSLGLPQCCIHFNAPWSWETSALEIRKLWSNQILWEQCFHNLKEVRCLLTCCVPGRSAWRHHHNLHHQYYKQQQQYCNSWHLWAIYLCQVLC